MKYCPKCIVHINTDRKTCPLCFEKLEELEEIKGYQAYPTVTAQPRHIATRILWYFSLLIMLSTITINLITYQRGSSNLWFLLVWSTVLYTWILYWAIISKRNAVYKVLIISSGLSIFMYAINVGFSNTWIPTWSINYVIPFNITLSSLMSGLLLVSRIKKFHDYILSAVALFLSGIFPIILYFSTSAIITTLWPSIVASAVSGAMFLGMLVFVPKQMKEEIEKRFHV